MEELLEPQLPFEGAAKELDTVARLRGLEPAKLPSQLRGDLDWIVMKALEKDRKRRYASTSTLALDIERHLKHEPVDSIL